MSYLRLPIFRQTNESNKRYNDKSRSVIYYVRDINYSVSHEAEIWVKMK